MELLPARDSNVTDTHVHPATELMGERRKLGRKEVRKKVRKKVRLTRRQLKFMELYNNIMGNNT